MEPRPSRLEQKQATRERLLIAARVVLAREGLGGTTTRAVATEAGVAVGTVFVHFPDVAHLVEALLDAHLSVAVEAAVQGAARRRGLVKQLVHVAGVLFESYDAQPELARAYLSASLFGGAAAGLAEARLARFEAWVAGRINRAVQAGEVPPVDPSLAFGVYFSLYFGALVGGLRGRLTRAQQTRLLVQALERFFHVKGVTP